MIKCYYGGLGSGKTYAMTADVLKLLRSGRRVYTNYWIKFHGIDEWREAWKVALYRTYLKTDLIRVPKSNLQPFEGLHQIDELEDCVLALDEGWLYFDSYSGIKAFSLEMRRKLMQSRKDGLDLFYTTQRPVAVQAALRAVTNSFVRCERRSFLGVKWFSTAEYYDLDSNALPTESTEPNFTDMYFARSRIFNSYDTLQKIGYASQVPGLQRDELGAGAAPKPRHSADVRTRPETNNIIPHAKIHVSRA